MGSHAKTLSREGLIGKEMVNHEGHEEHEEGRLELSGVKKGLFTPFVSSVLFVVKKEIMLILSKKNFYSF